MTYNNLVTMSEDIVKEYVGVTLTPQIIEKIDERARLTGVKRQEIIRTALINELFQGC